MSAAVRDTKVKWDADTVPIHQPYRLNMQVPLYLLVLQIGSCEIPNNSLDLPGPLLAGRREHIRVQGGKWEEQNLLSRLSFEASPSTSPWDLNCMRQFRFLAEFRGGIYIYILPKELPLYGKLSFLHNLGKNMLCWPWLNVCYGMNSFYLFHDKPSKASWWSDKTYLKVFKRKPCVWKYLVGYDPIGLLTTLWGNIFLLVPFLLPYGLSCKCLACHRHSTTESQCYKQVYCGLSWLIVKWPKIWCK